MGMTASIGVGDANNVWSAKDFIMKMFARFDLDLPPIQVTESREELEMRANRPNESNGVSVIIPLCNPVSVTSVQPIVTASITKSGGEVITIQFRNVLLTDPGFVVIDAEFINS